MTTTPDLFQKTAVLLQEVWKYLREHDGGEGLSGPEYKAFLDVTDYCEGIYDVTNFQQESGDF